MAWSIVGVGTSVEVTATAHALTVPAGVAAGDLLVACIASRIASTTSITLPTGGEWTLVSEQKANNILTTSSAVASAMMAYCVRGASDPNLTFTHPVSPGPALGRIVAYRGGATPTASAKDTQTSSTTAISITAVNLAGLTTTAANDLIVAMLAGGQEAAWSSFNATTPSGASGATDTTTAPSTTTWIERADVQTTTSNDTSLGIFDAVKTAAGATGNFTATASVAASHALVAGAFKILLVNRTITADAGSYVLTGTAATFQHTWKATADAGSYALTGADVNLVKAAAPIDRQYIVGVPSGSVYVSDTGIRQYSLPGSYIAETFPPSAGAAATLTATAGSYALTGATAGLYLGREVLAVAGSYGLTGQPSSLEYGREVLATGGSYTLSGAAATLLSTRRVTAVGGSYALSGLPVNLLKSGAYAIIGLPGSYALTGQPATLSKAVLAAYALVASPGSYTLTGSPTSLIWSGEAVIPPGSGQRDGDAGERRKKRRGRIYTILIEAAKKVVEKPIPLRKKRKKLAKLIAEEVLPDAGGLLAADKLLLELMIRRQLEQIPLTDMHTQGWYELQDQLMQVITDAEQTAQLLRAEAEAEDDLLLLLTS